MSNVLTKLIYDTKKQNPDVSLETIRNGIINSIEKEIIPSALRQVNVPKFPTPAELASYKFREKRKKQKFKTHSFRKTLTLWQQVEYVKHQLNGEKKESSSLYELNDLDSSTIQPVDYYNPSNSVQSIIEEKDGFTVSEEHYGGKLKKPSPLESMIPYPVISRPQANGRINFKISKEITKKITTNQLWRRLISGIELNLRRLASSYTSPMSFNINVRKDIELSNWEKTILSIDVPEMDFERKMILWEIIDKNIRKTIQNRTDNLKKSDKKKAEQINRNIFTKMVLN